MNKVLNKKQSWKALLKGEKLLYDAVSAVYGPNAGNAILGGDFPHITHDGVSVAKHIDLSNVEQGVRESVEMFREASERVNSEVGDGTTSAAVLTHHLLTGSYKKIRRGVNPQELRRGLEAACAEAVTELKFRAEPIEGDKKKIAEVATISAGDQTIGELVAEVFTQVGKDGAVTVERSAGFETEAEIVEGFTFPSGYMSQYFADNTLHQEVLHENAKVLLVEGKVNSPLEMLPLIEKIDGNEKLANELVIIVEEMDAQTLGALVANKQAGNFNSVVITAPSFGERMKQELKDIAALTGATIISSETGITLKEAELEHLGSARKVVVGRDKTTIIGGAGDTDTRVRELQSELNKAKGEAKTYYEQRLARLNGKVAIIRVGGASDKEVGELKDRIDDAVYATKAALAEGIVAGGGVTLREIANTLSDDTVGHKVLKKALKQPEKVLLRNIGIKHLWKKLPEGYGVNVRTSTPKSIQVVDMKSNGIIDPVKATRGVIQTAVSIVALIATTEVFIAETKEKGHEQRD